MSRSKKHRGEDVSIIGVNLLLDDNEERCHTNDYETDEYLIVRRGDLVKFEVEYSRPLSGDKVELNFHRGYRTSYRRGTRFSAQVGKKASKDYQLSVEVAESDGVKVLYSINLPANFPVGSYRLEVEVCPENTRNVSTFEVNMEMVVLFNPWCKDDGVYMPEEERRDEYVMNETGIIYAGTFFNMFTWPWNYAQFHPESLRTLLYLMDMSPSLDSDSRRDPVKVTRVLTEMVNQEDSDGGILYGLWSSNEDDYADGTDPMAWSGSVAIFKEYLDTKKPVRYGQCWVFGGTLTSILRCAGIPTRPITTFESAHDGNANRAIDFYFDHNYEEVKEKSGDSIWNYHVWVESWMTRPDLGEVYGGWQAIDATPQEISPHSRSYVVGPASVAAIKDGQDMKYDNEFVISEVNADVKYYYEVKAGEFELAGSNITKVGKCISTKSCGSNSREDITDHYKYREGTMQERAALGVTKGELNKASNVTFDLDFASKPAVGEDVDFIVKVGSTGDASSYNVHLSATIKSVNYIGIATKLVKKFTRTIEIKPESSLSESFTVPSSEYLDLLSDQAMLNVTVLCLVDETHQSWVGKKTLALTKPDMKVTITEGEGATKKVVDEVTAGTTYDVEVTFTNPLNKPLTKVVYFVEGAKLTEPLKIEQSGGMVGGRESVKMMFQVTPPKPRRRRSNNKPIRGTLVVTCQSTEMKGIMGVATLKIT